MIAITHAVGSACALSALDWLLPGFSASAVDYYVCIGASILPDIDTPRSVIGRIVYPVAMSLDRRFGHRGAVHSFAVAVFLALIVAATVGFWQSWPIGRRVALVGLLGYVSHIFLDWMTTRGAQSYWPSSVWCVLPQRRSWRIQSGSRGEVVPLLVFLCLFGVCFEPSRQKVFFTLSRLFISVPENRLRELEIRRSAQTYDISPTRADSLLNSGIIDRQEWSNIRHEHDKTEIELEKLRDRVGSGVIPLAPDTTGVNYVEPH